MKKEIAMTEKLVTDRPFMKGIELCELFYREAVRPVLKEHFSDVDHSAALLFYGSEVLGFDTPQSMDHDWGPRLQLFLTEEDHPVYQERIDQILRQELPREIHGYPTSMARVDAEKETVDGDTVTHAVQILTVRCFLQHVLTWDPDEELSASNWLTFPEQHLCGIASGRVFHDGLGQLEPVCARLHYYPHDVWLYMLAAQWRRIGQAEAFMGRCGQVGDDLGSRLVAAHLVRDLMKLCFLMERRYAPYIKWFGSAFAQLGCAGQLGQALTQVLCAETWPEREKYLATAYTCVAAMHNDLHITDPLPTQVSQYHDRPFLVIHADRFVKAIREKIASEEVRALPDYLGSVDQFTDSTEVLNLRQRFNGFKFIYRVR
jgi:hypothetical protein